MGEHVHPRTSTQSSFHPLTPRICMHAFSHSHTRLNPFTLAPYNTRSLAHAHSSSTPIISACMWVFHTRAYSLPLSHTCVIARRHLPLCPSHICTRYLSRKDTRACPHTPACNKVIHHSRPGKYVLTNSRRLHALVPAHLALVHTRTRLGYRLFTCCAQTNQNARTSPKRTP